MWWSVGCLVFWVVRMPFLQGLFRYVSRTAQYPISIYPAWLRVGLTVLLPLGLAVTAPAEAFTSRLTWGTIAVTAAVTAGSVTISRLAWTRAVRRYSGASA